MAETTKQKLGFSSLEPDRMYNAFLNIAGAFIVFVTACTVYGQIQANYIHVDKVTTFTISDFGRTLQSNGTGCDHGWGSHHLIMGGAVNGGTMYGTFPTLALGGPDDSGSRGALIPTTALAQYGATLAKWFGVSDDPDPTDLTKPTPLEVVFPSLGNFSARDLGFLTAT
jgi:uncharacterized protein (DUF1501 family)